MLADDVDGAFARGDQIAKCIFCVGITAGDTDGEERGIVANDVRVGEGREVGGTSYSGKERNSECATQDVTNEGDSIKSHTVFRPRTYKRNRSRNYAGNQQFVVKCRWPSLLVWIDLHMIPPQALTAITSAVSIFPPGVFGLGESKLGVVGPVWARFLRRLEVGMGAPIRIGGFRIAKRGREMVGSLLHVTQVGECHHSKARWTRRSRRVRCSSSDVNQLPQRMLTQDSSASDINP